MTYQQTPNFDSAMDGTYRKIAWRLIPYIFVCYIFNYLDRVNVGFAKLQMLDDLGMSEAAFGFGAGIFFLGYVLFGVPSNLMLQKIGARRWLALIMVLWGSLSAGLSFVSTPLEFYILRALTGAAEAGFFPGIVLYLTRWFPSARRGRVMALFMSAIPLSGVFGGPFSGWILDYFQAAPNGLEAWQWLFLLQGLPTVFLGVGLFLFLPNGLQEARWLTEGERAEVGKELQEDEASRIAVVSASFGSILSSRIVWILGLIYFCIQSGVYAINFWLPTLIKTSGITDPGAIGWLSAIPYLAATIFMALVGVSADKHQERRWHLAVPMVLGALGLLIAGIFADSTLLSVLGLSLAAMGALTSLPMFWPLASGFLSAAAAAAGLALINSLGQIAGFASPYLVGWVKDATQATDSALYLLAAMLVVGAIVVLAMQRHAKSKSLVKLLWPRS